MLTSGVVFALSRLENNKKIITNIIDLASNIIQKSRNSKFSPFPCLTLLALLTIVNNKCPLFTLGK